MSRQGSYLVADVGGTNARFAIARGDRDDGFVLEQIRRFKNQDFADLHEAAQTYLEGCSGDRPSRGCVAVAGPVAREVIQLTNSTWRFRPDQMARDLGLSSLLPVNDFAAQARGALLVSPDETYPLNRASPEPNAPCAVLGPGTGLGLGLLIPRAGAIEVVATEGGHAGFAPRTEEERGVARFLSGESSFVSWERLLSGAGLVNIHRALCYLERERWPEYRPEDITREALADPASLSRRVVLLFCSVLGAYAGDVAVMSGARGGVYLSGGILPTIRSLIEASDFRVRFEEHGPMTRYASAIPVWLLESDTAPLLGAAALAGSSGS